MQLLIFVLAVTILPASIAYVDARRLNRKGVANRPLRTAGLYLLEAIVLMIPASIFASAGVFALSGDGQVASWGDFMEHVTRADILSLVGLLFLGGAAVGELALPAMHYLARRSKWQAGARGQS